MADRIRNIKSIQVFHTVHAAGNVTVAARDLSISQSSVSYHIKKLELDLGILLFRRTATGLEPTEAGAMLASHVERGLDAIRAGLDQVVNRAGSVRVALLPMFSSRWLSSRLGGLMEAHPDLHLSIRNHNNAYAHMANPESFADLGIQWGRGNWERFHAWRLWPERLVVVCSSDYLRAHPIHDPRDLTGCTLIHVDDTRMWDEWFAGNGLALSSATPQMMLEDRHFQLSSTINGLGVSLFAAWAVAEEIRTGALVDPFGRSFETTFAYHLIVPRGRPFLSPAQVFRDWLLAVSGNGPHGETPGTRDGNPL